MYYKFYLDGEAGYMKGEFKMAIGRTVREIAQYYSSEESFAIKTGKHLPNWGAIIGVI